MVKKKPPPPPPPNKLPTFEFVEEGPLPYYLPYPKYFGSNVTGGFFNPILEVMKSEDETIDYFLAPILVNAQGPSRQQHNMCLTLFPFLSHRILSCSSCRLVRFLPCP